MRTQIRDRPGALVELLTLIAGERVNVIDVAHLREGFEIPLGDTAVELLLQTRDEEHCLEVLARLEEWGFPTERLR